MPYNNNNNNKYKKLKSLLFWKNVENNCRQLTEEDFRRGVKFHAKFIGSLEISRPVSRLEIVAAMRKVRFEFRVKGAKKRKVLIDVSVDGVHVNLNNRKKTLISHHQISKIFYVSHDSQDLKIFSYITSNETSKIFRCNVFKSNRMSQAVQIVKTIGQVFDISHKLSVENRRTWESPEVQESPPGGAQQHLLQSEKFQPLDPPVTSINKQQLHTATNSTDNYKIVNSVAFPDPYGSLQADITWHHIRQQMEEHKHQNDMILVQMQMIHSQLEAERSSRINAEVQMQDLIRENQNLLFRVHSMMRQLLLKGDNSMVHFVDVQENYASPGNEQGGQERQGREGREGRDLPLEVDVTFDLHHSPDSGHDDTISSSLSRFRTTWCSSGDHLQFGDESRRCHGTRDGSAEVMEHDFDGGSHVLPLEESLVGNFSKHLSAVLG